MVGKRVLRTWTHEVDYGFFLVWLVHHHGHIDLMC